MCHKTRMALARAITRAYDDALRSTGLRATQASVLAAVGARGALSIKSLAYFLEMERTTLTRNLGPLEERGYVLLAPERRHPQPHAHAHGRRPRRPAGSAAPLGRRPRHDPAAPRRAALAPVQAALAELTAEVQQAPRP